MKALAVNQLISAAVVLGEQIVCRPATVISAAQVEELARELDAAIANNDGGLGHLFDCFTPLMIRAMRGAIKYRARGDEFRAARFVSIVGSLLPDVRREGFDVLAAVHTASGRGS